MSGLSKTGIAPNIPMMSLTKIPLGFVVLGFDSGFHTDNVSLMRCIKAITCGSASNILQR